MAADTTNLFVGPCTLYVDGTPIGWTRGGIRMRVNKSVWGRPSLSGLGIEELVKQSEDYYISTILVETTMDNLRKAWGINEAAVGRRIDFGGSITVPTHILRFVAEGSFFEAYFYKAVAVDFGEITFSPKADAFIPVTFRALLDTTKAPGVQIGYIIRGTSSYSNITMRVTVPKLKTRMLWSTVTVYFTPSTSDVVSRVLVRRVDFNNLVLQITVPKIKSRELVSRVLVVYASTNLDLVCRIIVFKKSESSLICRVTKVAA